MNLLIVDDDPTARALLRQILKADPSAQIAEAGDGAEAWRLLDDPSRYFDAVFLDVNMAPVNGLELLGRIRGSQMLRSTPVILCTASNDRTTVTQAIKLGIRHYLVKPFSAERVNQKLEQIRVELEPRGPLRAAS